MAKGGVGQVGDPKVTQVHKSTDGKVQANKIKDDQVPHGSAGTSGMMDTAKTGNKTLSLFKNWEISIVTKYNMRPQLWQLKWKGIGTDAGQALYNKILEKHGKLNLLVIYKLTEKIIELQNERRGEAEEGNRFKALMLDMRIMLLKKKITRLMYLTGDLKFSRTYFKDESTRRTQVSNHQMMQGIAQKLEEDAVAEEARKQSTQDAASHAGQLTL